MTPDFVLFHYGMLKPHRAYLNGLDLALFFMLSVHYDVFVGMNIYL